MSVPCPTCIPIECFVADDAAIYSLESGPYPFVLNCPPGFSCQGITSFQMLCCNQLLSVSIPSGASAAQISALIGSVVAECSTILPFCGGGGPPTTVVNIYQNQPQICSKNCPDGTTYVYTVPAGVFGVAATGNVSAVQAQNQANQQAQALACQQASLRQICLSQIPPCTCKGTPYSATIVETGGVAPFSFTLVSGALPPGLTLNASAGTISGTPTVQGVYAFAIRCTSTVDQSYNQKSYTMTVLTITTTSLPGFVIGTPYSFQLQVTGGSGFYDWVVSSGALPAGLTLSLSGLISGTPTGGVGVQPMTFVVIDTLCETAGQSFFPPAISMSTKSTTQIATVLGWQEFGFASSPPKKFQTITWTGSSEQQLWYRGVQIGGAKYDFAGQDQIDLSGNITSSHTKILSVQCNGAQNRANIVGPVYTQSPNYSVAGSFLGYFGTNNTAYPNLFGPTQLCSASSIPYKGIGNVASDTPFQYPASDLFGLWGSGSQGGFNFFMGKAIVTVENNVLADSNDSGTANVIINPYALPLVAPGLILEGVSEIVTPIGNIPLPPDWNSSAQVIFTNNFSATLSNEYTDAIALANAQVIVGNGNVASNVPRTTGFVSQFTNVVYTLTCTNLIAGTNYTVSVDFADLTAGTVTTKQYPITGDATGQTMIVDTVPNPIAGHSAQVRNARIQFT